MTTHRIVGQTFPIRPLLKAWGARWDGNDKCWYADGLSSIQIATLRQYIGVTITENKPRDRSEEIRKLAALLGRAQDDEPLPPRRPTQVFGNDSTYLNYFADKDPIAFFGFDGIAAFADYVEALPVPPDDGRTCSLGWDVNPKFERQTNTHNMAAALDLARNGWTDGLGLLQKLDAPRARNKRRVASVAGGSVNVGRLLAGNPAHMITRKPLPKHRNITLFVECCMWRGILAENAIMRAFIIGSMIDRLETEGYRCSVVAVSVCHRHVDWTPGSHLTVQLKEARDRLSLLDIMFALGHPAFLRRLEFACTGSIPDMRCKRGSFAYISSAFNANYPCKPNEFYIPQLSPGAQASLTDDPLSMVPFIEPDGLPVTLKDG